MTAIGKYEARNELNRIIESREPVSLDRLRELGRAAEVVGMTNHASYKSPDLYFITRVQFSPPLLFGRPNE